MTFPASLTIVTIHGTVLDGEGLPRSGRVIFRSAGHTMSSGDDTAVVPRILAVDLDEDGYFEIDLPSSNDPDWVPIGWTYTVTMDFGDDGKERFGSIVVPYDLGSSLSLYAIGPVPSASGKAYALLNDPRFDSGGGGPGGAVDSVFGRSGNVVAQNGDYTKAQVGLGSVDNTSDASKPVSTATATALSGKAASVHTHTESEVTGLVSDLSALSSALSGKASAVHAHVESDVTGLVSDLAAKAPLASPTFTGTVAGITAAMVGLGNVNNTSDANKPVSTAQQTALNLKADLASPTFTGTVSGISKVMVGLGNVDNTADSAKPVSTAQAAADGVVAAASIAKSLLAGKGSLIAASGAATPVGLAVGADGLFLQADSASAGGVKWASGGGGGGTASLPLALNPKGGRWAVAPIGRAGSNFTPTINRLYLIPLPVGPVGRTLTGLSFEVATAAGAGGLCRFMVLNSTSDWEPNLAAFDYGTVATDSTGAKSVTSMTDALSASTLYWVGLNFTVAAPVTRAVDSYNNYVNFNAAITGTSSFGMFVMTGVTGALGATPFTFFDVDMPIRVGVRFQ